MQSNLFKIAGNVFNKKVFENINKVGISVCKGRIITWSVANSEVKTWPEGLDDDANNVDILGRNKDKSKWPR